MYNTEPQPITELTELTKLFDIPLMKEVLSNHLSESVNINKAFAETRHVPEESAGVIEKIVFGTHEDPLEKAALLKRLFNNSHDVRDPAAKNKVIRNFGYLLFAKPQWFDTNLEFAQQLFQRKTFDDVFFTKQRDNAHLFKKITTILRTPDYSLKG